MSVLDNGTIYNDMFFDFAVETARKNGIPFQIKQFVSGGNDAKHISLSGSGVKTIALSAPARYIHTASNVIRICDFDAMEALVFAIARSLI